MMKRHNKLLFASIGAFSGAMLGSYVSTKLNKDENKER
jgi:outer membrane lipoprotein SlyB